MEFNALKTKISLKNEDIRAHTYMYKEEYPRYRSEGILFHCLLNKLNNKSKPAAKIAIFLFVCKFLSKVFRLKVLIFKKNISFIKKMHFFYEKICIYQKIVVILHRKSKLTTL